MIITRMDINGQIKARLAELGIEWSWGRDGTGRLLYSIGDDMLTPGEAADKYLPGGFAGNFGR